MRTPRPVRWTISPTPRPLLDEKEQATAPVETREIQSQGDEASGRTRREPRHREHGVRRQACACAVASAPTPTRMAASKRGNFPRTSRHACVASVPAHLRSRPPRRPRHSRKRWQQSAAATTAEEPEGPAPEQLVQPEVPAQEPDKSADEPEEAAETEGLTSRPSTPAGTRRRGDAPEDEIRPGLDDGAAVLIM